MTWVRLDDHFPEHPKVVKVGQLAAWLHVCALAYCNRHLTDGEFPASAVATLTNFHDLRVTGASGRSVRARPELLAKALVAVGLWDPIDDGYRIHDYLEYQPSRQDITRVRQNARERMSELRGNKRRSSGTPVPETRTRTKKNHPATPHTAPLPESEANSGSPKTASRPAARNGTAQGEEKRVTP